MKVTADPRRLTTSRLLVTAWLGFGLCLAVAACGQSGPLFLPVQEPAAGSAPAAAGADEEKTAQPTSEASATAGEQAASSDGEADEEAP
jgi:predicted small lipoprotein YifL